MKIHRIWEVGDECVAVADGGYSVTIKNDIGGSGKLPKGRYLVRIVKEWDDDETGQVLHGVLLDEKDIEKARKAGTTPWTAEHYRREYPKNPKLCEEVAQAKKTFNPKVVYFSEHSCEPMEGR